MKTEENGLVTFDGERPVVVETVHPLPNLLELGAGGVLESMCRSQKNDFTAMVAEVEEPGSPLHGLFADLRTRVPTDHPFHRIALFRKGALQEIFLDLHDHVMSHPVWLHPFFVRVFEGRINLVQVAAFAIQYFNQIKNTRQCVAMAIGRFHGLAPLPYGVLNERVSEITQVALAQLVADEFGVGSHALEDYPDLRHLLLSKTHMAMYRQLFEGLDVPPDEQDEAMLPGVADNVLTQRLVASHPAFSPLESLSSVGLGMEWGVPEFFSLILGGLIRVALREKSPLTPRHLEVFIAHVRYDVLHAVSVMLVTSLHMQGPDDIDAVKGSCNTLMAGRFAMMTDLYRHVFGERCATLAEIGLDLRYR
ncbi:MAG: hypothetical protein P4M15_11145, partial [Alphaproteobacteria bacterium]|nr:hypothetical protein [Alphaproteobacteria bacterium]